MSSTPRRKPWETHGQQAHSDGVLTGPNMQGTTTETDNNNLENASIPPQVPPFRNSNEMSSYEDDNNNNNNNNNNNGYQSYNGGNPGFGTMFGMNYSSPYSMGYGGGINSYGMGYGGYGGGMGYGMGYGNRYGGGMVNNNGGNSSINGGGGGGSITESTMATFQLLENLIGAINGFAQMLESSYMATYNSFFTLISFAEEINRLKEFFGSFLGIFSVIKFVKKMMNRIRRGSNSGVGVEDGGMVEEFKELSKNKNKNADTGLMIEGDRRRKLAWKPLILFFMAVFGFPYLMNKYIERMNKNHVDQLASKGLNDERVDLSNIEFGRAIYDFVPENPTIEVSLTKGDLMAIISKRDTSGRESPWWRVRTKKGDVGYIPSNYIEIIKRRKQIE